MKTLYDTTSSKNEFGFTKNLYTVDTLYQMWKEKTLIPRPIEFQRKLVATDEWKGGIVYTALNRTASLTLTASWTRLPDNRLVLEVLDGQQRITSLFQYLENRKTIVLRKLSDASADGKNRSVTKLNALPVPLRDAGITVTVDPRKTGGIEQLASYEHYGTELARQLRETPIEVEEYGEDTTNEEKAEIFFMKNNTNDLVAQEKRNGVRGWVARIVRGMVRTGTGSVTPDTEIEPYKIPVSRFINEGANDTGIMSHLTNDRLELEECLARLFVFEKLKTPFATNTGYASDDEITKMYRDIAYKGDEDMESDTSQDARRSCETMRKAIERRFKHMETIIPPSKQHDAQRFGKFSNTRRNSKVFSYWTTLYVFLMWLDQEHKGWKFGNECSADDITDAFMNAFKKLTVSPKDTNPYPDWNETDAGTGKATMFSRLLGKYAPHELATKCEMLLTAIQLENANVIRLLDPKRNFSFADKVRKWKEQGERCAYTNKFLVLDHAVAGHKIAHSKGGRTTYDNLVVISRSVNQRMGDMSWDDFRDAQATKRTATRAATRAA